MGFESLVNGWTVLFPLAVLLYYFFRKRYVTKTISSTLFWEQSMRETRVSPYLKNLQQNALFYLQMAALLLLLFILLGPFINKEQSTSYHTIFIVDTSASMLASKDGVTLFEKNRTDMKELLSDKEGGPVSIITSGKEPNLVIREEKDPDVVLNAINQLTVTYEHETMNRSLEFVKSIAMQEGADVHIFTDYLDRSTFADGENPIAWTVHNSKENLVNVSIDKFGAIKTTDGIEAIVKIGNHSLDEQIGTVRIKDVLSGSVLEEKEFTVEGDKDALVSFKELADHRVLEAEILINDDYDVDNSAYILVGGDTSDAIVDGQLHELVKKAFEAIGLDVTTGSANEMRAARDSSILVTNDVSFLKKGTEPILLIGRNDATAEPIAGLVTSKQDPLFTIATIDDIYVSAVYPPFKKLTTIASVGEVPFIQRSGRGDIIVLADIESTDWPLHPSFPLFVWSSVEMLHSGTETLGTFIPNERKAVLTSGTSDGMEVFTIEDEYVTTITDSSNFVAPSKPGIYKVMDDGEEKLLAIQLEQTEKQLHHGTSYRLGISDNVVVKEEGKNPIGWLFLLPVLLLLLIEWEVQRRRGYPN